MRSVALFFAVVLTAPGWLLAGCGGREAPAADTLPVAEPAASGAPLQPVAETAEPTAVPAVVSIAAPPTPQPFPSPTPLPTIPATGADGLQPTPTLVVTEPPQASAPPVAAAELSPLNRPLPTPQGVYSWTLQVPILMYHYVSAPPQDADVYRTDLSVDPESFRQQMAYLKDNGYSTVDFYDLSRAITAMGELPTKPVILTFDDGYVDNYQYAFPILKEYGFTGTFFLATDFIDKNREGYLTWDMVREMAQAGMRFESHSKSHPDLRGQPRDYLIWEIRGSQETLAAHLGYTPRYFAYPGGAYDQATVDMLSELDFWGAVTTENGLWHGFKDRFEWRRVRMRYTTTLEEFARFVDPGDTVAGKPPGS